MATVFETQTLFDLKLDTNYDLSTATVTDIVFKKPDDTTGTWEGDPVETTKIQYQVQSGDIDQHGNWEFQSKVTDGGRTAFGKIVTIQVSELL